MSSSGRAVSMLAWDVSPYFVLPSHDVSCTSWYLADGTVWSAKHACAVKIRQCFKPRQACERDMGLGWGALSHVCLCHLSLSLWHMFLFHLLLSSVSRTFLSLSLSLSFPHLTLSLFSHLSFSHPLLLSPSSLYKPSDATKAWKTKIFVFCCSFTKPYPGCKGPMKTAASRLDFSSRCLTSAFFSVFFCACASTWSDRHEIRHTQSLVGQDVQSEHRAKNILGGSKLRNISTKNVSPLSRGCSWIFLVLPMLFWLASPVGGLKEVRGFLGRPGFVLRYRTVHFIFVPWFSH